VLIVAGALTALVEDLADAEIAVHQQAPAGLERSSPTRWPC
jgi:hypothetical protein